MKLSVVIPARNEEQSVGACLDRLLAALEDAGDIPYELIVVDDNSTDDTAAVVLDRAGGLGRGAVRLVRRRPPPGFGRAVRSGIEAATGEVVVISMADLSDEAEDVVAYYRKIAEGYDCVFGSRFVPGGSVSRYPKAKLVLNRMANHLIRVLFRTELNDMTNAFKGYRAHVLRACGPPTAAHFDVTLELALGALLRGYSIAEVPVRWTGRTGGSSKLRVLHMGARYFGRMSRMLVCRYRPARWRAAGGRVGESPAAASVEAGLYDER